MLLSTYEIDLLCDYFAHKPIMRAYVFWSYIRDTTQKEGTDFDLLLELDYSKHIGMKFFGFQQELEDLS
ncbi:MAG: hypothetical protein BGO55_16270 [Sphingobacteriales bacterium 50-39]|nr:MAG: hypothetical protein BGO55_16270 [Sphingobacteriales bacterium 50-39]